MIVESPPPPLPATTTTRKQSLHSVFLLQMGSVHLPVWSWRKVTKAQAVTMKTVSKAALDEADAGLSPDEV